MNYTAGQPVPLHKNGVFVKGWAEDAPDIGDNAPKKA
jgi:hypothetical protein